MCKEFAKFLLTYTCQNDIKNYGLFSTTNITLYESDFMYEFEQALKKEIKSKNVFTTLENIKKTKEESFNNLFF